MKLIFIGKQGSGKGTQAQVIAKELNLCHISTGDLLRAAEGELKDQINEHMNKGSLVPDTIVLELLKQKLQSDECKTGFILDGFPRNLEQAKQLQEITDIDKVIEIYISDEEALNRLLYRINCKNCGAIFNSKTNPPKQEGICDKCGKELFQRQDDTEDSIKTRLDIYEKDTKPLLEFYKDKIIQIEGEEPIEQVKKDILELLNQ